MLVLIEQQKASIIFNATAVHLKQIGDLYLVSSEFNFFILTFAGTTKRKKR